MLQGEMKVYYILYSRSTVNIFSKLFKIYKKKLNIKNNVSLILNLS